MAVNPLGGIRFARGLQLTNGKAALSILKKTGTVGLDQRLGRPIRSGHVRVSIKPVGKILRGPPSVTLARPLTDAQLNVRTGQAGIKNHSRTKIW